VLLHSHFDNFFWVVIKLPKQHINDQFGRASSLSEIDLVWASEPKLFQKNIWQSSFLMVM